MFGEKPFSFLNYDENDGIFDHVAPPVPAANTPGEFVHRLPIGAGFRVPCIIVSPWTVGGHVFRQRLDHTSALQFLEEFTAVREPNISDWRRQTFGSLSSALRFEEIRATPPSLPDTSGPLRVARYESTVLPKPVVPVRNQQAPKQNERR